MAGPKSYFVRWRGQVSGPYTQEQLERLVRSGALSRFHQISTDRQEWLSLPDAGFLPPAVGLERHREGQAAWPGPVRPVAQKRVSPSVSPRAAAGPEGSAPAARSDAFAPEGNDYALFPLAALFRRELWGMPAVRWTVALGVLPLALLMLHDSLGWGFGWSAWLLCAYFCLLWAAYFRVIVAPAECVWKEGLGYAIFTATVGTAILLLWQQVPLVAAFYAGTESRAFVFRLLGFILGVGLFEETCKMLPMLFFGLRRRSIRSLGDGLFLGIMSGLGFGMKEGVGYTLEYWWRAAAVGASAMTDSLEEVRKLLGDMNGDVLAERWASIMPQLVEHFGGTVLVQVVRLMVGPLLHASWAGVVGYFIAAAALRNQWGLMFMGLAFGAVVHGMYDVAGGTWSLLIAALSVLAILSCIVSVRSQAGRQGLVESPMACGGDE